MPDTLTSTQENHASPAIAPSTLVLIDGHSLAYRMYFALERTAMSTHDKQPTWAVYGFFNAIFALLRQIQPGCIAMAFDMSEKTFRSELYEAYKAHREAMPDALRSQMSTIYEGVQCLGIPIYQLAGFEADDVIGTLSKQAAAEGHQVLILTGDQDAFQLVDDAHTKVLIPSRTPKEPLKTYDRAAVFEKFGVYPEQVIDFKGLKGDTSDNIPGVPGIGDKTAAKFLSQFGTLEGLYQALETTPATVGSAKIQEKLTTFRDQAMLSQKLATIDRNAPVQIDLEHCQLSIPSMDGLLRFFQRCEFRSFIQQAPTLLAPFLSGNPVSEKALAKPISTEPSEKAAERQEVKISEAKIPEPKIEDSAPGPVQQSLGLDLTVWHPESKLITTEGELQAFCTLLDKCSAFAIDIETTGLDVLTTELVGIALSVSPQLQAAERAPENKLKLQNSPNTLTTLALNLNPSTESTIQTVYIPVGHCVEETGERQANQLEQAVVLKALTPYLTSSRWIKIVHNGKFEANVFESHGILLDGLLFDTMLASYVQNPDRRHGLKGLAFELLQYRMQEITELIGSGKKQRSFAVVAIADAAPYACSDAQATLELAQYFVQHLTSEEQSLLYEVELPLAPVLARMERCGISLDTLYLKHLSAQLSIQLAELEQRIWKLAGGEFNLNSPKQVGEVLFERLGITPLKKTASKSAYSTDAKVLEQLAEEHEIVQQILDYRQLFKLKSTYIDNLPDLIHPKTGRLHTSFNQTITATGRLSSSSPNLQNIPIRSELGRQIRRAFIPPQQDTEKWFLVSADYSQIELRLLAHFSEDPNLVKAFQAGQDIHTATAALVFDVPADQVSKEQRYRAKTVNFGVIYGQSAHSLSQQLKTTRYEAQAFIDRYFETYSKVKGYIDSVKASAHQTGSVTTLCGRHRDLSEGLNSPVRSIREFSERAAFNTPLQGSAADLMKVAMIRLAQSLETVTLNQAKLKTKLLLQVHDEVVLEVPESELELVKKLILESMSLDQPLLVPLVVDLETGSSWMET